MGRYSNVQSYSDDNPSMRKISYEQATGNRESQLCDANKNNEGGGDGGNARDEVHINNAASDDNVAKAPDTEDEDSKPPPPRNDGTRSAISPSACNTNCLFVGGLHPRIQDLHLRKLFSPYGDVVRIHIVTHSAHESARSNVHSKTTPPAKFMGTQQSKGYAFVEYTAVESARRAISKVDGRQLCGRTLAVRPSHRKMNDSRPGQSETKVVSAEQAHREASAIESKIEAVKRAIEQKKKGS